jgi:hypothetical protein
LLCSPALQGIRIERACDAAGVRAFPTWVIKGNVTEGEMDFAGLKAALQEGSEQQQQQEEMAAAVGK